MNYTYLLRCADGSLYCGWTNNLQERIKAHNTGKGGKYTRARLPVTLVYAEEHEDRRNAMRREAQIKKMARAEKEKLIQSGRKNFSAFPAPANNAEDNGQEKGRMSKILFFDLDGTLWDGNEQIPESAVKALILAQKEGHKICINTGRTRSYVHRRALFELGIDALITGCATGIELPGKGQDKVLEEKSQNRTVLNQVIDLRLMKKIVEDTRSHGFHLVLEGPEFMYMEKNEFIKSSIFSPILERAGNRVRSVMDEWGTWEANKISCDLSSARNVEECIRQQEKHFRVYRHNAVTAEFTPKGRDKGKGLEEVCALLGYSVKDAISFGDGCNDIPMLQKAGIGVAMGNASEEAKSAADIVCPSLQREGIASALKSLGCI